MTHTTQRILLTALSLLLLWGCDMIDYHPYDVDIDAPRGLTQKNISLIQEQCQGKDTIRFAQLSDTQRWYDDTEHLVIAINQVRNLDFVIHTGDMTDFGLSKEYKWMQSVLDKLRVPCVCIIGNHDCIGTGETAYSLMYGPDNYSFNASFLHIVCLNTNAYEYDYSDDIPNFNFIKTDQATLPDTITASVVAMHVGPEMYQFNDNVADYFNYRTMQYPGLRFCICGHDHRTNIYYPFGQEGPTYFECGSAKTRTFILYTITRDSYSYEIIEI